MSEVLDRYNYPSFIPEYFMPMINFHNSPSVGSRAPDFPLWNLDKSQTSLKAILASNLYTIVEFGSFT